MMPRFSGCTLLTLFFIQSIVLIILLTQTTPVLSWSYSMRTVASAPDTITQIVGGNQFIYAAFGSDNIVYYNRSDSTQIDVATMSAATNTNAGSTFKYVAYHGQTSGGNDIISAGTVSGIFDSVGLYSCAIDSQNIPASLTAFTGTSPTKLFGVRGKSSNSPSDPQFYLMTDQGIIEADSSSSSPVGSASFSTQVDLDFNSSMVSLFLLKTL